MVRRRPARDCREDLAARWVAAVEEYCATHGAPELRGAVYVRWDDPRTRIRHRFFRDEIVIDGGWIRAERSPHSPPTRRRLITLLRRRRWW